MFQFLVPSLIFLFVSIIIATIEKHFDEAAMLHFIRDCLFQPDSPLHQELSNPLQRQIAERITYQESEVFPCMPHNLRRLQAALTELQAKCVHLEVKFDIHQQKWSAIVY